MNIKTLIAWCIAHPELAVVAAGALLSIPGAVYALVKTAYQAITGRPAKGSAWTVLDVVVEVLPNLPGAINRAVRGAGLPSIFAPPAAPPPAPSKVPAPIQREGERGTVRVSVLVSLSGAVLVATLAGALLAACPGPVTPVDGGPAVTPSSWTSTARVVITTLRWALPAARAITDLTVAEPGRTQVARALDAAAQATDRLHGAVDAYEARGGDRCAARAAVGGLQVALVGVAQVLADNGVALGTTLERIVDAVASIADALIPACDADAGWASAGDGANARLRAIAEGARARGVTLRRVLDDLRPMDAGAL